MSNADDYPITRSLCRENPRRAPRVLVIDDEKRIAETLALILDSKGYIAEAAYDGSSALAMCDTHPPDLVISDVVMPGMNGIEVAIALGRKLPTCRVLLFSGQAATAEMLEEARSRGHEFELLAKPVHPEQLLERVRQLIGAPATFAANPAVQ